MPLSCNCNYEYEPEPGGKIIDMYGSEFDSEPFKKWISKRCVSCNELISMGYLCIEYKIYRYPYNEIEAKINGSDWECLEEPTISAPSIYHCEKCGEIFLNLQSVGFECLWPGENMPQMLKDYQIEYNPPKLKTDKFYKR